MKTFCHYCGAPTAPTDGPACWACRSPSAPPRGLHYFLAALVLFILFLLLTGCANVDRYPPDPNLPFATPEALSPGLSAACAQPLPPPAPVSHGAARAYAAQVARALAECRAEAFAATTSLSARAPRSWK